MVKNKAQDFFESEAEVGTGVIKIYTPRKYGHPGVPIFTWFWGPRREYRDPLLPAKKSWCVRHWRYGFSFKTCQVQVNGIYSKRYQQYPEGTSKLQKILQWGVVLRQVFFLVPLLFLLQEFPVFLILISA